MNETGVTNNLKKLQRALKRATRKVDGLLDNASDEDRRTLNELKTLLEVAGSASSAAWGHATHDPAESDRKVGEAQNRMGQGLALGLSNGLDKEAK